MKNQYRAKKLLANNTEANEVHFTSDGFAFFSLSQCESNASRLADKTIETVTREQTDALPPEGSAPADNTPSGKPLNKMNKTELAAEVAKRNGLTVTEGATKDVIVKAIEDFDAANPTV